MEEKQSSIWLSIGQTAKLLGISRDTLRRWEKKGIIKAFRFPTNRRYYTKDQLQQIMSGKTPEIKTENKVSLKRIIQPKPEQTEKQDQKPLQK
ncbi:hypothetical protein A3J78_00410 [Candidatus Beckwithbacteria bacterium RBG_13_35_6]|uniref:HTH merR-type domain-containing protein n=1 Tax=Candidatus Beckwithbacteria bacterium RBG_13_35_6 TaxID=1797456 RepID=A0A1F5DD25_9BACT|nr:MAG: hypothetical protein A3J78_00410 [Candidatus Beckwithbacteria bacterium RBG_13_35_6]